MFLHPRVLAFVGVLSLSVVSTHQGVSAQGLGQLVRCKTPSMAAGVGVEGPTDCAYSSTNPTSQYESTFLFLVPVVFHVIRHSNGQGNLSAAQVQSQIDILNEDFRGLPGTPGAPGYDTMIQFYLATVDPDGRPTTGITFSTNNTWFNDGGQYYNSLAWDPHRYLNIYSNNGGGALGYVPSLPQSGNVGRKSDRIVVLWNTVGRNGSYGSPYNMGRTVTHEAGHYLGLWHTFDRGCGTNSCYTTGDTICDTNKEQSAHWGCAPRTTCSSPDPINNYMDYSDDRCMWEFTSEQSRRMRCTLEFWRPDLWTRGVAASVVYRSGGVNVESFRIFPPVIGGEFRGAASPVSTGHTTAVVFGSTMAANVPMAGGFELLVDLGPTATTFSLPPITGSPATFSFPIPNEPALSGVQLFTQAGYAGGAGPLGFSNAQDLTFGK